MTNWLISNSGLDFLLKSFLDTVHLFDTVALKFNLESVLYKTQEFHIWCQIYSFPGNSSLCNLECAWGMCAVTDKEWGFILQFKKFGRQIFIAVFVSVAISFER